MNIKDFKSYFVEQLMHKYDVDECTSLFYIVIDKMLNTSKMKFVLVQEKQIEAKDEAVLQSVIKQLLAGKPIQYVLGEAYFFGLPFFVDSSVLIPRPETEELVEWILENVRSSSSLYTKVLDVGTGSGCIPVALKKNADGLDLYGMDISSEAIEVAKKNAALNEAEISFIQADIFKYQTPATFDIIVSNPPYIKEDEKGQMHENVLDHEPHTALFVTNEHPLVFYEEIAEFSKKHLKANGLLFFEINEHLGAETVEMLRRKGFRNIVLRKDMQGKDRMIRCQWK
jgi:release factor glutamine methyltransferase